MELAPYTNIGLGGRAALFFRASNFAEITAALQEADRLGAAVMILGGGSNVIFRDCGFDGLVLRIELKGQILRRQGKTAQGEAVLEVAAGENWDAVVLAAVKQGLSGLECLSGIPGFAGAAPIQNIGAYGQEIGESLVWVECLDRKKRERKVLSAAECRLSYRNSRFKSEEPDRFIITRLACRLKKKFPLALYPQLRNLLEARGLLEGGQFRDRKGALSVEEALQKVRLAVLQLRRQKSMLPDNKDRNTKSVGSFFINPVLNKEQLETLRERCRREQIAETLPVFPLAEGYKVPAAWIIERAGFQRGMMRGGVGISERHTLALVNRQGSAAELLALAREIELEVTRRFGVTLQREAVVV